MKQVRRNAWCWCLGKPTCDEVGRVTGAGSHIIICTIDSRAFVRLIDRLCVHGQSTKEVWIWTATGTTAVNTQLTELFSRRSAAWPHLELKRSIDKGSFVKPVVRQGEDKVQAPASTYRKFGFDKIHGIAGLELRPQGPAHPRELA